MERIYGDEELRIAQSWSYFVNHGIETAKQGDKSLVWAINERRWRNA